MTGDLSVRKDLVDLLIERCQWVCWLTKDLNGTSTNDPPNLSIIWLDLKTTLSM
jgi:hypothetical protein